MAEEPKFVDGLQVAAVPENMPLGPRKAERQEWVELSQSILELLI